MSEAEVGVYERESKTNKCRKGYRQLKVVENDVTRIYCHKCKSPAHVNLKTKKCRKTPKTKKTEVSYKSRMIESYCGREDFPEHFVGLEVKVYDNRKNLKGVITRVSGIEKIRRVVPSPGTFEVTVDSEEIAKAGIKPVLETKYYFNCFGNMYVYPSNNQLDMVRLAIERVENFDVLKRSSENPYATITNSRRIFLNAKLNYFEKFYLARIYPNTVINLFGVNFNYNINLVKFTPRENRKIKDLIEQLKNAFMIIWGIMGEYTEDSEEIEMNGEKVVDVYNLHKRLKETSETVFSSNLGKDYIRFKNLKFKDIVNLDETEKNNFLNFLTSVRMSFDNQDIRTTYKDAFEFYTNEFKNIL